MITVIYVIVALIVGVLLGYFWGHSRNGALRESVAALNARLEEKINDAQHDLDMQEKAHKEAEAMLRQSFNETMERVTAQIQVTTNDVLAKQQAAWSTSSKRDMDSIVTPLKDSIAQMQQAMDHNKTEQTKMTSEMHKHMESMMKASMDAKASTDELARVFKFGNKVQGEWGEAVLEELLKGQGLTPGIHYETQVTLDNGSYRPDVILHLSEDRDVIIDAKVSLSAFLDYVNTEDLEARNKALKEHIASINKHVEELSRKNYPQHLNNGRATINYVIMFVPNTGALWTALKQEPALWRNAMAKNVFIADEQTLYAALRIVDLTWRQITQVKNHEKVFKLADQMIERLEQFLNFYEDMGTALDRAKKHWENGYKKITEGGQSINTTAHNLIKLGAKPSKVITGNAAAVEALDTPSQA